MIPVKTFSPGDSIVIDSLRLKNFKGSAAGNLGFSFNGRYDNTNVNDLKKKVIGTIKIYSKHKNIFFENGKQPAKLADVIIEDDANNSVIKKDKEVQLIIPKNFNMKWYISALDTTIPVEIGGDLLDENKTVVISDSVVLKIPIKEDFNNKKTTISNLWVSSFKVSKRDSLRFSLNPEIKPNSVDTNITKIGKPTVSKMYDSIFVVGETFKLEKLKLMKILLNQQFQIL